MQRDRDPSHYLDLESHYERRPSIWVEPRDVPWGKGSVQVVEIPSNEEIHDNMVAFWAFDKPFQSGSSVKLSYSLIAADSVDEEEGALARVDRTRIGWGGVAGAANPLPKTVKRFLIDFRGGDLATFDGTQPVSAEVHNTKGKIDDVAVTKVPGTDLWRLSFRLTPDGDQPADMRIFLKLRDQRLTETWSYLYAPSAVE
jgi:glucans biosynthesis protein